MSKSLVVCSLTVCVALGCADGSAAPGVGGSSGLSASGGGGATGISGSGGAIGGGGRNGAGAAGGAAGVEGFAGEGGVGGNGGCPDAIGNRPTLTAQPTIDSPVASPGTTVMLDVPVSRQTRLIRARAIVDSTAIGEVEVSTLGAEVVSIALPLDSPPGSPPVALPSEAYIGLTLCADSADCLTGRRQTFVSYVRLSPSAPLYFINVFDDGIPNLERFRSSCFEVLTLTLEPP